MTDRPTVFCKDCKFFRKPWTLPSTSARCGHTTAVRLDKDYLVSGVATTRKYCTIMRFDSEPCGEAAKLWEPRK